MRVVIQIAPAVRVALGEAYGIPSGENVLDQLVTALKIMGADEIYDTIFGADLTVREESKEFLRRLETGENLPLMTSCCPSWVRYVEQERPQFIKNLSSALSPMQMFATVLKDKYREKDAADGRTTFHIAIMPCTAKKMEAGREEFRRDGVPNVDLVLTTQEVIKMIKESGIRFQMLLQRNTRQGVSLHQSIDRQSTIHYRPFALFPLHRSQIGFSTKVMIRTAIVAVCKEYHPPTAIASLYKIAMTRTLNLHQLSQFAAVSQYRIIGITLVWSFNIPASSDGKTMRQFCSTF